MRVFRLPAHYKIGRGDPYRRSHVDRELGLLFFLIIFIFIFCMFALLHGFKRIMFQRSSCFESTSRVIARFLVLKPLETSRMFLVPFQQSLFLNELQRKRALPEASKQNVSERAFTRWVLYILSFVSRQLFGGKQ